MAYEVVMPYHLHMPSYFLETFTEYPFLYLNCAGLPTQAEAQFENLGELKLPKSFH